MSHHRIALVTVAVAVAAQAGCSTYSVRRAALVPHAQPTLRDGQPIGAARGELGAGIATLMQAHEPSEGDTNAGVQIPRIQANGALRFQPTANFDIGMIYEHGFEKGATAIAPDQPNPSGDTRGIGVSLGYSIPTRDPGFRVGLTMDFINYTVPFIEYETCIDVCGGSMYTRIDEGTNNVPVISLGVIPSLKRGPWTFFASMTLRNHPTIERGGIEGDFEDEDVESGPMNAIAAAGASYTTPARVRASLLVYQPISRDPVAYAPTLAAAITVPFGSSGTTQQPRPLAP